MLLREDDIEDYVRNRSAVIDVVVTNSKQRVFNNVRSVSEATGIVAMHGHRTKIAKHEAQVQANGHLYIPFASDVYGFCTDAARELVQVLAERKAAINSSAGPQLERKRIFQQLSVALMRSHAMCHIRHRRHLHEEADDAMAADLDEDDGFVDVVLEDGTVALHSGLAI